VIALAGGPVNPTTLLPIPEAAQPAVTTTTDTPASSPEATSLPRNETTTAPASTSINVQVADATTTTTTTVPGSKRTDPPGASNSNRPSNPGQGKP
jgi:hypothetical protein